MIKDPPTLPQLEALDALDKLTRETGQKPGYKRLAKELGISKTAARARLLHLERKGLVDQGEVEPSVPWEPTAEGRRWIRTLRKSQK